jgi:glycosyltransferase involved in cell wall biosynthesis
MSNPLSVVIITKNEEDFIEDAIKSAQFAEEVVVLDSFSDDKTFEVAKRLGAKVSQNKWLGFGAQKNLAVSLASNDWVFVLDADERITPSLKNEIIKTLKNPLFDGYQIARLNSFFGKSIKSCGLYPDYSVRLFSRHKGKFEDVPIHESVKVDGKVSKLKNHMIHLAYDNVEEFIEKQKRYANLSTKKKSLVRALLSPVWTFLKLYFFKFGFLDGQHGFLISKIYALYTFWKYYK